MIFFRTSSYHITNKLAISPIASCYLTTNKSGIPNVDVSTKLVYQVEVN